jgi:hypothetical protein
MDARSVSFSSEDPAQIRALFAHDSGQALTRAKAHHKQLATRESEALLVEAYQARIACLKSRGLKVEAKALAELCAKRYPRLPAQPALPIQSQPRESLEDLVRPLSDPALDPDRRAAIATTLRRKLRDPRKLAECQALPEDHELRRQARAIACALEAVTSRPVSDTEVELPEVPRKSPLSPWKLLLRAIACFYRGEDEAAEAQLYALDKEAAPARLVPALRSMMRKSGESPEPGPRAAALAAQVVGDPATLRETLAVLDRTLERRKKGAITAAIGQAIAACRRQRPELLDELRQEISVRTLSAGIGRAQARAALGGSSLKDARFWRLLARTLESEGELQALLAWEQFRQHALAEGWFAPNDPAHAVLCLHLADELARMPAPRLAEVREALRAARRGYAEYYVDQPSPVREVGLRAIQDGEHAFLHPERMYQRACAMDPDPDAFARWLAFEQKNDPDGKDADEAALAWHEALPKDTRPLLQLMAAAEKRGALGKALRYLQTAESLDALSPRVRRAGLRLHVAIALRHARESKLRLLHQDIEAIASLRQVQENPRRGLSAGLRWLGAALAKQPAAAAHERDLAELLGSPCAGFALRQALAQATGLRVGPAPAPRDEPGEGLLASVASACALISDLGLEVELPRSWESPLIAQLSVSPSSIEPLPLRALAEAANGQGLPGLAYAAAGAGLSIGGPVAARFLLLRAQSLPPDGSKRRRECLEAAFELARRQRDQDLLEEIGDLLPSSRRALSAERVSSVLDREQKALEPPSGGALAEEASGETCGCPVCLGEEEEDDEDLPPGLESELVELIKQSGVPREAAPLFLELIRRYADSDGSLPDLDAIAEQEPEFFARLIEMAERTGLGPFGRSSRRRRKQRR